MVCFHFGFVRSSKKHVSEDVESVKIYSYKELRKATDNFSAANKIGEGGFGSVYKARLKDGSVVAAKVLSSESKQCPRGFMNEINVIQNIVHENLVRLLGCCAEESHRILVHSYIENNSLSQTLLCGNRRDKLEFNWKTRTKICIGIARGLAFLHEEVHPHIVHRDIKASNILLDKDLNPKISDFGLAKLLPPNETYVSTRVAGTIGYLAPEYAIGGRLTRRADTYSFGVLLLEILSGKRNMNKLSGIELSLPGNTSEISHGILLLQAWSLYQRNELIVMIDESLNGNFDVEEAHRFLKVALLCTQDSQRLRPSMSTVIKMLTDQVDVSVDKITEPGIITNFMDLMLKSVEKDKKKQFKASSSSGSESSSSHMTGSSSSFSINSHWHS